MTALDTRIERQSISALTLLQKNARRMSQRQFDQLVENIRGDGRLTSVPLVHREPGGKMTVLSGNHRVRAAGSAGLDEIDVMIVDGELDTDKLVALQLSHNAIAGDDDQAMLEELYASLSTLGKKYSGLTETDFSPLQELDLSKLAIQAPRYEAVNLMFLPEDRELFVETMEKLGKGAAKAKRFIGRLEDFRQFEDALVIVQDGLNIHNQALAIATMSELALERLQQLEGANGDEREQRSNDDNATATGPFDEAGSGSGAAKQRRDSGGRSRKAARQPADDLPHGGEAP